VTRGSVSVPGEASSSYNMPNAVMLRCWSVGMEIGPLRKLGYWLWW
jgi:hypothetical protein